MKFKDYEGINSKDFENLIVDLYNIKEGANTYSLYGRPGQKQHGIDIYSSKTKTGIQCKYKNGNQTFKAQKAILIRELKKEFMSFYRSEVPFEHFILVSTFPHDVEIQNVAIKLSEKYKKYVSYIGWDIIKDDLVKYPIVRNKYFGKHDICRNSIEMVSHDIDETLCDWINDKEEKNSYSRGDNNHSNQFPVFDFRFINNSDSTIILNEISVHLDHIPGISGMQQTGILSSQIKYKFKVDTERINLFHLKNPIYAQAKMPFRFHIELIEIIDRGKTYGTFSCGYYVKFIFKFNGNIELKTPRLII